MSLTIGIAIQHHCRITGDILIFDNPLKLRVFG